MAITNSPAVEDYAVEMVNALHRSWRKGTPIYKIDAMWDVYLFIPHPNGGMISSTADSVWYMLTPHIQDIYDYARRTYNVEVD
jgi:hypothetical protein